MSTRKDRDELLVIKARLSHSHQENQVPNASSGRAGTAPVSFKYSDRSPAYPYSAALAAAAAAAATWLSCELIAVFCRVSAAVAAAAGRKM